jgi:hypothetical protein
MPSLIDRFTALFRRSEPETATTADERVPSRAPSDALARFKTESGRKSVVQDCRRMYDEDPRAKGVIHTLARDVTMGGFQVQVTGGINRERAQRVADDLLSRLDLVSRLDDWLRLTLRDGDTFLEIGVDEEGLIRNVTRKPTLQTRRNSDPFDRFADPARAYWLADEVWLGHEPPDNVLWFASWQIIHARWDHDEGHRYGRPLFAAARKAFKRLEEGELDVAVRRKTRAGMKYVHVLEGASEADLERYKEMNKAALDNPFAAVADFFMNKAGGINVVQGDAQLGDIVDVQHHIDTWSTASPLPLELLGYGRNLNRDVLDDKKKQYDETLEVVKAWAISEVLRPLVTRQWLLQGIWPDGLDYTIVPAQKREITPQDLNALADALVKLKASGMFSPQLLVEIVTAIVPWLDATQLLRAAERVANGSDAGDGIAPLAD